MRQFDQALGQQQQQNQQQQNAERQLPPTLRGANGEQIR